MATTKSIILLERIEKSILLIRGEKVMLDADLARLYGVKVKALNQAVKRNATRFPSDFMFQLTAAETKVSWSHLVTNSGDRSTSANLRSQIVTSRSHGGRRHRPFAFTELGVAMLSSVLRSPRAIAVNIEIMRVFVQLRRLLSSNAELARKLDALEKRYDKQFRAVFAAIRELMKTDDHKPTLGFARDKDDDDDERG